MSTNDTPAEQVLNGETNVIEKYGIEEKDLCALKTELKAELKTEIKAEIKAELKAEDVSISFAINKKPSLNKF